MIKFLQNPTKTRKFFLGLILVVVIVSMVAYLGQAFTNDSATVTGVYATVDGEPVSTQDITKQAQAMGRQQLQGQPVPDQYMPFFQKRAAQQLIMHAELLAEASRMGLKVTDEELRDELRTGGFGQQFFPKGNYIGDEAYKDYVANAYQIDVPHFEKL